MFEAKTFYLSKPDIFCIPDALSAIQLSPEATWNPQQDIPVSMSSEKKKRKEKNQKIKKCALQ